MRLRSTLMPRLLSSERLVWQPGLRHCGPLKSVALANVALCCLHMEEYEAGLDSIRDAISLKHAPDTPAEMLESSFC